MRTMTRGKAAIAGVMALGLALVATPAQAAELGDAPIVTATPDTFSAGSWGDGVAITASGLPDEVTEVTLSVNQPMSPAAESVTAPVESGEASGTVSEFYAPPVVDGNYTANASYSYTDGDGVQQFVSGEGIELVITEGMAVDGPAEATVGELAAGVELQLSGFVPNETLSGDIGIFNPDSGAWESIGSAAASVGEDGSGIGILEITGATAGDQFRVELVGEAGSVVHWITATEGGEPVPTPEPEPETEPEPTPESPKKPERVETGA